MVSDNDWLFDVNIHLTAFLPASAAFFKAAPFAHLSGKLFDVNLAAGKIRAMSLSITFTDIALPICLPSWARLTTTLKVLGSIPCSRSIPAAVNLLPLDVTQWP